MDNSFHPPVSQKTCTQNFVLLNLEKFQVCPGFVALKHLVCLNMGFSVERTSNRITPENKSNWMLLGTNPGRQHCSMHLGHHKLRYKQGDDIEGGGIAQCPASGSSCPRFNSWHSLQFFLYNCPSWRGLSTVLLLRVVDSRGIITLIQPI